MRTLPHVLSRLLSLACAAKAILSFLETKAADFPHVAAELVQMSELYTRKLWHQITLLLLAVSEMDGVGSLLQPLYETFVSDFKHRLNKLALARLQSRRLIRCAWPRPLRAAAATREQR